ncbi:MAG: T9SS type A sorting domain-containing protein [Calditrichaceae bacterium]
MKQFLLFFTVIIITVGFIFAQDTVYVDGIYTGGAVGSLNDAIDAAKDAGTINNKVFKLTQFDVYVLSKSIFINLGESLEIVADKPGDDQDSAPPQIVWTDQDVNTAYIIQSYGDVTLKNIWVRHADLLGNQISTSITFEDSIGEGQDIDKERGTFDRVIFDFCPIGSEAGGAITVKADHFIGKFTNCYFRNLSDNHFRYYGRAVSFPYESQHFHYDSLLFENCTFSNLGRIVMQEGNEFGDNVHINHCTLINCIEWAYQSAGWLRNTAITNSIFVNPYLWGYRPLDVCPDSLDGEALDSRAVMELFDAGECDGPGGGLINGLTEVDSFGFTEYVDFTDAERGLYIANIVYTHESWIQDYYINSPEAVDLHQQRQDFEIRLISPMLSDAEQDFIDSVDIDGNKMYPGMNVDWASVYTADPEFIVPPTNVDTLKLFLDGRWYNGLDIQWAYDRNSGLKQEWPLPENLAYNNADYQTAAMGGFPLGDLNWYPDQLPVWEAQRETEWDFINTKLSGVDAIKNISTTLPVEYVLKQNYPNPFNPTTNIEYSVPVTGQVSLKVYNTLGQLVATLQNGNQKAGSYMATFDANNLASGVYIYKLQAGDVSISKKLILMK